MDGLNEGLIHAKETPPPLQALKLLCGESGPAGPEREWEASSGMDQPRRSSEHTLHVKTSPFKSLMQARK
jgi:hypothetical protein